VTPAVVYNTMLFFQAATQPARLRASMQAVHTRHVQLCVSKELIAEIEDVLCRPEYQTKFPVLQPPAVEEFIADIVAHATLFDPIPHTFTWPRHPDDDHLFNLAILSNASYLVTWENRILKLGTETSLDAERLRSLAPKLEILTPKQFSERLRTG
jgi:putative PIN family toxin of toxin-antitoxin system